MTHHFPVVCSILLAMGSVVSAHAVGPQLNTVADLAALEAAHANESAFDALIPHVNQTIGALFQRSRDMRATGKDDGARILALSRGIQSLTVESKLNEGTFSFYLIKHLALLVSHAVNPPHTAMTSVANLGPFRTAAPPADAPSDAQTAPPLSVELRTHASTLALAAQIDAPELADLLWMVRLTAVLEARGHMNQEIASIKDRLEYDSGIGVPAGFALVLTPFAAGIGSGLWTGYSNFAEDILPQLLLHHTTMTGLGVGIAAFAATVVASYQIGSRLIQSAEKRHTREHAADVAAQTAAQNQAMVRNLNRFAAHLRNRLGPQAEPIAAAMLGMDPEAMNTAACRMMLGAGPALRARVVSTGDEQEAAETIAETAEQAVAARQHR